MNVVLFSGVTGVTWELKPKNLQPIIVIYYFVIIIITGILPGLQNTLEQPYILTVGE